MSPLLSLAVKQLVRDELATVAASVGGRLGLRETPTELLAPSIWPKALEDLDAVRRQTAALQRERHRRSIQAVVCLIRDDRAGFRAHFLAAKAAHEQALQLGYRLLDALEAAEQKLARTA